MIRGEVWWVERPEYGRRPHLLLTRDTSIPLLTRLVAVPATRTIRELPTEVRLGPDDGLPSECVLNFDNVSAVPRAYFVERICALRGNRMREVCKALAIATGCD